ncbi:MAG: PAS domain-containing protein [Eubacteriales bacterium]
MQEFLFKMVEDSDRAVVLYHRADAKTTYANKLALSLYGDGKGGINIEEFFMKSDSDPIIFQRAQGTLEEKGEAYVYDFMTRTAWGEEQLTDIHIGYTDEEKTHVFLKIDLKEDHRLERIKQLMDRSHRAEAIMAFDKDFTILYTNQAFLEFTSPQEKNISLSQIFPKGKQAQYLKEIESALKKNKTYYTEMEIMVPSGEIKEVALDFQHMELGDDGKKLVLFLNPLDETLKRTSKFLKFNSMISYFEGIQVLSGESLYLVDLKENILVHKGKEDLRLPAKVLHFPESTLSLFHPEDGPSYIQYINRCRKGEDGVFHGRLKNSKGEYLPYEIVSIAILDENGVPVELLGKVKRILPTEE